MVTIKSDPADLKKNRDTLEFKKKHIFFKFKNSTDVFVSRLNTSEEKIKNLKMDQKKISTMQYEEINRGKPGKVKRD